MSNELARAYEEGRRAERAAVGKHLEARADSYLLSLYHFSDVAPIVSDLATDIEYGQHLPPELRALVDAEMDEKGRRAEAALEKEKEDEAD